LLSAIRRHLRSAPIVAFLALALGVGTQVGTAAAATYKWLGVTPVPISLPTNAGGEPDAFFGWGACPTAGWCAGVGAYTDEHGNQEALVATRASGSWGPASEITLPAGAATGSQKAGFGLAEATVACTGRGACVAVGHYIEEGGGEAGMVAEETSGVWGTASKVRLPAHAAGNPEARLRSVACPAAGSCAGGGEYHNENGDREAMVVDQTSGVWGQASEIEPPMNAESNPNARISSIACSAAGSCVAIGAYRDESTATEEAMVATETGGSWGQASQVTPPANAGGKPSSELHSLVCVTSGPCVAAGKYTDGSGDQEAMAAEETSGMWGMASEIKPPANAASNPEAASGLSPVSIACPASGSCVIIGKYTDGSGDQEAMAAEETSGMWARASEIKPPAHAASNPEATLYPACPTSTSGSCVAAGAYTDEGGDREAMVAEETSGVWGQASEITAPGNAESNPQIIFGEVQCPAAGSCIAFGEYKNSGGKFEDMEVTGTSAAAPPEEPVTGSKPLGCELVAKPRIRRLCGSVNLHSSTKVGYYFEYNEGASCAGGTKTLGAEVEGQDIEVSAEILEGTLQPRTEYTYCLVATNPFGETPGLELTFETADAPPTIAGESASNITESDATLEAQINPGGEAAYYAEYGTSACEANSCGTKTSGEGFLIGDTQEQGSLELTNLKPNTIYHYWVVATNSAAPEGVHGQAMEFTTPRAEEEVRDEEVERDIAERVNAEAKARAEAEARTAAAGRERQEEAAAAAAKKKQEEAASKSVSITIVKVEVSSSSVTVTLDASQAGTVTISDPGLKTTTKSVAVGNHEIKVLLTKAGKQDRKRHRRILITAKLKAAGRTVSESKTVKL
jgi:hypothetical protein